MYIINSYRNNLIISPFVLRLLHYKQLWWANVRWEFVLLSSEVPPGLTYNKPVNKIKKIEN